MKQVKKYSLSLVRESANVYPIDTKMTRSHDVAMLFETVYKMTTIPEEIFCIACLDTKNKIIGTFEVSRGSLSASIVHPREVFKRALLLNSACIILCHNHPSGNPEPSREDEQITKRLIEGGEILGIHVLDHIIIGDPYGMSINYSSFKELELM